RLLIRMQRQRQLHVQRPALEETDGMRSRRPRDSGFGVGQANKAAAIDLIHARAVRWMCHIPTCTTSGGGAEASHALNSDREGRTRGECDFRKEMEAEDAEKRISASWWQNYGIGCMSPRYGTSCPGTTSTSNDKGS